MLHFIRVYTVCKGKKDLQTKNTIFFLFLQPDIPRYVQWTIPSLLYQTRRKNSLVYKQFRLFHQLLPLLSICLYVVSQRVAGLIQLIFHMKRRKWAKNRNQYNQVPHLTQDTIWQSDKNTRKHHTIKRAKRSALS